MGVTAVGSGVAQTVIDGLWACAFPVRIVGFELAGRAKGLFECDTAHRLPPADDPRYAEQLASLCREEAVELLIPGSDPELPEISEAAPELQRDGCQVLISSRECVRVCRDKKALHDFLVERGAPFFPTGLARDVVSQPDITSYPAILKPRWGSGSVGIQVLATASDWDAVKMHHTMGSLGGWVVQPMGRPSAWNDATWQRVLDERRLERQDQLTVQLFVGGSGEVIGRMAWLGSLKCGVVTVIEVIDEPEIWCAVEDLARAACCLRVQGSLNLQGIWAGEQTRFFEVNPRFSGSTGARALLGYREVEAAVRYFGLGESEEDVRRLLGPPRRWVGLRQMTERVVPELWVQRFETTGCLSRPLPLQRILIIGGSGYPGQEVIRALLDRHPHVEIVVPVRNRERMEHRWEGRTGWDRLHLLDWEELEGFSPDFMADALLHVAVIRPPSPADPSSLFAENLRLTRVAVRAVRLQFPCLCSYRAMPSMREGVRRGRKTRRSSPDHPMPRWRAKSLSVSSRSMAYDMGLSEWRACMAWPSACNGRGWPIALLSERPEGWHLKFTVTVARPSILSTSRMAPTPYALCCRLPIAHGIGRTTLAAAIQLESWNWQRYAVASQEA